MLQQIGDEREAGRDFALHVGDGAGGVRIHAGEHGGAGGQAERIDHEAIAEGTAFAADAIHVGRLDQLVAGRGKLIPAQAFANEADDVRLAAAVSVAVEASRKSVKGFETARSGAH